MKLRSLTWCEWHSFVVGFAEGMNPLKSPVVQYPDHVNKMIESEFWYYATGIGLAPVAWVGIMLLAVVIVKIIL